MRPSLPIVTMSDALGLVSSLSKDEFANFRKLPASERSFSPNKKAIASASTEVGLSVGNLEALLSALGWMYDRLAEFTTDAERRDGIHQLLNALVGSSEPADAELVERLSLLLSPKPEHEHFKKISRLERGALPQATAFETFVDMRPDFADDLLSIRGYIPVITFFVRATSVDPTQRQFTFSISAEQFESLKDSIDRLSTKLSLLKAASINDL